MAGTKTFEFLRAALAALAGREQKLFGLLEKVARESCAHLKAARKEVPITKKSSQDLTRLGVANTGHTPRHPLSTAPNEMLIYIIIDVFGLSEASWAAWMLELMLDNTI